MKPESASLIHEAIRRIAYKARGLHEDRPLALKLALEDQLSPLQKKTACRLLEKHILKVPFALRDDVQNEIEIAMSNPDGLKGDRLCVTGKRLNNLSFTHNMRQGRCLNCGQTRAQITNEDREYAKETRNLRR